MKKRIVLLLLCLATAFSVAACGKKKEEKSIETFEKYTDVKIFQDIPAMDMDAYTVMSADEYGDNWYVMELKSNQLLNYAELEKYVKTLESDGFKKYADNGKTGIDNSMFAATLTRDNMVVALTFIPNTRTVYIAAAENKKVSPHLLYDSAYLENNIPEAKTTMTMQALNNTGNCYVIQLKNGHYIINDGGFPEEANLLIDYLIENAPDGQKPVVEAWFISHDHEDHMGPLQDIQMHAYDIIVEGFYSNTVSKDVARAVDMSGDSSLGAAARATLFCKNSAGEATPLYRMHAGERYYFNDITVEVLYTCEQIEETEYEGNLNASSTWLMYYIEGQKVLMSGDTEIVNMRHVAEWFDKSFFAVDLMNVPHHGYNFYSDDLSYYTAKTLIYANPYCMNNDWWPSDRKAANLELQKNAEEIVCWADGSKRFTFPYTVGSVETIPSWYPEYLEEWTQNQVIWAAEAGVNWTPAKIAD